MQVFGERTTVDTVRETAVAVDGSEAKRTSHDFLRNTATED